MAAYFSSFLNIFKIIPLKLSVAALIDGRTQPFISCLGVDTMKHRSDDKLRRNGNIKGQDGLLDFFNKN